AFSPPCSLTPGPDCTHHPPVRSMRTGSTAWRRERAWATEAAERSETSCSPERPPKRSATVVRVATDPVLHWAAHVRLHRRVHVRTRARGTAGHAARGRRDARLHARGHGGRGQGG